ncbi:hypothetical protein DN069_30570 [Streptacidiphilus pinicola]|uniref:Uncharacterized protein n=1 Tax=Streptacidiphilus pinicola TaxID=2219663 RepID=A0A2X0J3B9_9ACTN|nr:hypothetical protein [Streptacidiphilus pinicola]RAG81878.1 hypothetical protein DN069_30570 [Streptacidiphilus pinicola]
MLLHFTAHPFLALYALLLLVSGIGSIVMSVTNLSGQSIGWRIFGVVAGLAFAGYGVYMGFVFDGGEYIISFKAIILPFALLASLVARMRRGKPADAAAPVQGLSQQSVTPYYGVPPEQAPYAQQPYAPRPAPYGQAQPYGQFPQYQPVQPPVPPAPQGPQG